jgi:hypothetical protein
MTTLQDVIEVVNDFMGSSEDFLDDIECV